MTERPDSTKRWPMAHRAWVLPAPGSPKARTRLWVDQVDEPGLSAPAFAQKREWAPLGGKIVGQTSTAVRGLALQRTFTFRSRLVP